MTKLEFSNYNLICSSYVAENSSSDACSNIGDVSQETSPNTSEPAIGSHSPSYSPPDSPKASSVSEPDLPGIQQPSRVVAAALQVDQDAPSNLTGARKRKAHRAKRREVSFNFHTAVDRQLCPFTKLLIKLI